MPVLQTPQEFVSAVREQRLVDSMRLKAFVMSSRGHVSLTARRLADRAVAAGLLTPFQADEILAGNGDRLALGDYRLLSRLGEGSAGGVFLAEHVLTGERRAVKLLHGDHADDPVARDRLAREARAASALSHPNLVRVFEYDPGDVVRPPFLAMEYVDGVSLQAAVALAGTFTAEAAAECGRQVALALQHAWDAGLVHRDVKPANLLLARDGMVKVLDFGLVRLSHGAGLTSVTGKQLLGTAAYIAPEQVANGSEVDCRADIYALGGTLYFLLAGHPPFQNAAWVDRFQGKSNADPVPVHHLRPDVPEPLSVVITAMLARSPNARPATPSAAARLLARWSDPAFADDLFTRLDRANTDTPPEGTLITLGPSHSTDRMTDTPSSAKDSTGEFYFPASPLPTEPQPTIRVPNPISKPKRSGGWWRLVAVVGLAVVIVAVLVALAVVR